MRDGRVPTIRRLTSAYYLQVAGLLTVCAHYLQVAGLPRTTCARWTCAHYTQVDCICPLFAGCWIAENDMCEMDVCRSNTPPKRVRHNNEAKFCCCSGDRCNENVTDVYDASLHTTESLPYPGESSCAERVVK